MPKVTSITVYPSEQTAAKVRRLADRDKRSVSYVGNELIEEALEARELQRRGLDDKPRRKA